MPVTVILKIDTRFPAGIKHDYFYRCFYVLTGLVVTSTKTTSATVEPRFNEVAGDRPNVFVKWRVRYIEVLFHTFYCNFGRDIEMISFVISRTSLNRGSLNRGSTVSKTQFVTL